MIAFRDTSREKPDPMRHIITLLGLSTSLFLQAQSTVLQRLGKTRIAASTEAHQEARVNDRDGATPLWSENFENGIGAWTVETQLGNVNWQLTSTGNTNGFTPGPLQSTTGFPGGHWIVADSDEQGTAGQSESTTITSPPILSMDTVSYMLLRFEQSFRQLNNDETLVEVSGNGGTDWATYPVNQDIGGNLSTPGAPAGQTIVLNISSALANGSSDIRIRFHWNSFEGYTYSWQLDDLALIPVRPNDLALHSATWAAWDLVGQNYTGMPCTIYPQNELRPLKFRGRVANNGSTTQTNVHLVVDVTGPDTATIELSSDSISLAPGEEDSLFIAGYTPSTTIGDYTFHAHVEQDQLEDVPADNSIDMSIRVDPFLFARDEGVVQSERDDGGEDYEIGNRFWMLDYYSTLYAVDVALGPGTAVGALITASVYDGAFEYVGESDFHTVVASDINDYGGSHFLTLPLLFPTPLDGGALYLVCLHAWTSDGAVWSGISGTSPAQSSMIYRYATNHWYYVTTTPMVRMNFAPDVGISESTHPPQQVSVTPSLFDDLTTVSFQLKDAEALGWDLRDVSGRSVRTADLGRLGAGPHEFAVSGDGLSDGVYLLTLHGGSTQATLRIVHQGRR